MEHSKHHKLGVNQAETNSIPSEQITHWSHSSTTLCLGQVGRQEPYAKGLVNPVRLTGVSCNIHHTRDDPDFNIWVTVFVRELEIDAEQ